MPSINTGPAAAKEMLGRISTLIPGLDALRSNRRRRCQLCVIMERKHHKARDCWRPHLPSLTVKLESNTGSIQTLCLLYNIVMNNVWETKNINSRLASCYIWTVSTCLQCLGTSAIKLPDINQQKTNYGLATKHFHWVFNLIYCAKMLVRPMFPSHEYSNEMLNLCWGDYWKATEACRILPKAWLKPRYALGWMTCWDTKS